MEQRRSALKAAADRESRLLAPATASEESPVGAGGMAGASDGRQHTVSENQPDQLPPDVIRSETGQALRQEELPVANTAKAMAAKFKEMEEAKKQATAAGAPMKPPPMALRKVDNHKIIYVSIIAIDFGIF